MHALLEHTETSASAPAWSCGSTQSGGGADKDLGPWMTVPVSL
jgi:hypothetical protein